MGKEDIYRFCSFAMKGTISGWNPSTSETVSRKNSKMLTKGEKTKNGRSKHGTEWDQGPNDEQLFFGSAVVQWIPLWYPERRHCGPRYLCSLTWISLLLRRRCERGAHPFTNPDLEGHFAILSKSCSVDPLNLQIFEACIANFGEGNFLSIFDYLFPTKSKIFTRYTIAPELTVLQLYCGCPRFLALHGRRNSSTFRTS